MLYLEDYLEMIEQLPEELRDRFTEIRELDLQVQNNVDSLEDRVKKFFVSCKSDNLEQKAKDEQFDKIKQDYYKALEDADDKVQITTQVYDLVDRHLRKLDQELSKFKMELEADSAGITELLERRSLELDKPLQAINNNKAEKRKYVMGNHVEPKRTALSERSLSAIANEAAAGYRTNTNLGVVSHSRSGSPAPQSYTLGQIGSGSNAIAVAASQAIAATQQTLSQQVGKKPLNKLQAGRRTASLKASYEAMKGSDLTKTLSVGKETFASGGSGMAEATKRSKKTKASGAGSSVSSLLQAQQEAVASLEEEWPVGIDGAAAEQNDWQYDPNEPRYCVCNQVSYGDMVACDNESCPFEWFHYDCVSITQPPKGKWYCPSCSAAMKRRGQTKERKTGDKEKGER